MSVPGILILGRVSCLFKLGRVPSILQICHLPFMHFFLPVKVGAVEILVLTSICIRLGSCLYAHSVVLLNKCLAAGMLL